ncbi:hypothetical protein AHAS_Ahas14G0028800 [Arachis hypogaea]
MEGEYKNNTGVSVEPSVSKQNKLRSVVKEVRKQICLAGPLIMVNLLNFAIELISIMFVGYVSELALSAVSMATSFSSVTGIGLVMGMASALDTFCGQSYGPGQHGIQDHEISTEVGRYAQLIIPYLFASSVLQCQTRFLQTQNIGVSMMLSSGVATALHAALCWAVNTSLTIWMIPFGLSGAISTRVSNELGAGNPWSARLAVHVVVVAAIIEGILVATLMIIIRNVWGHVYSNNVQVVRQVHLWHQPPEVVCPLLLLRT